LLNKELLIVKMCTELERCRAFSFHTPSSILVAGPSGCGKTVFTTKLLLDNIDLFSEKPPVIYYCYGSWQKGFETMKKGGVKFHEGVPESELLPKWFPRGGILVLDDLMAESGGEKSVLDIFTKHSHHQNITVIYLCQDLFPPGKFAKTINRNVHYIVAFKNPRDQLGFKILLTQSFPSKYKEILQTFESVANERPHAYIALDFHPSSRDDQRILSHLLKEEGFVRCYQDATK
jgi:hypothetical protein